MAKAVRHKSGVWMQEGTTGWEKHHHPPVQMKVPNAPQSLDQYMDELDKKWRKAEGRLPVKDLDERGLMLEGRIPWDPVRLKELTTQLYETPN
jgi:hypothetical protein